ncbi:hypothetical protein GCM10009722_06770 [Williamsia deligens]
MDAGWKLSDSVRIHLTHDEGFPCGHVVRGIHVFRPAPVWVPTLDDALAEDSTRG